MLIWSENPPVFILEAFVIDIDSLSSIAWLIKAEHGCCICCETCFGPSNAPSQGVLYLEYWQTVT